MSRHAGLGSAGAAPNLPTPMMNTGSPAPTGKRFSMFLTQIPLDFADIWLENLLASAGPLLSLRRVRDAAGAAKPFGFAEYGDEESVLRCLQCLNGLRLPSKVGDQPLTVKADAKTQASLAEYEASRQDSDDAQEALQATQNAVRDVLQALTSNEPGNSPASALAAAQDALKQNRPHLQDLGPDDLPAESRGQITKEIAFFRQQAEKREQAKKEQADRQRNAGTPRDTRASPFGPDPAAAPARGPMGRRDSPMEAARPPQRQWGRPQHEDPQSYRNGPSQGFVRGGGRGGSADGPSREEQEERDAYMQQEKQKQRREHLFRDRERQWEHRERQRASTNDREAARDTATAKDERATAESLLKRLSQWDDEHERRDIFYADRNRWRAQRRAFRARERDADAKDAKLEKEQLAAIQQQSDAFLANQADMFASLSGTTTNGSTKPAAGAVKEEGGSSAAAGASSGGPIKLTDKTKAKAKDETTERPKAKAAAFASAEDEEEVARAKRRLIPLDYSELEQGEDAGLTEAQIADRRKKRIQELVASIPTEKSGLWSWTVDWAYLSEDMLQQKLKPFVGKKVVDAIGDEDEDLVSACMSHLEAHKSAAELVEEMEPVLADEAEEFVIKIWRFLIFETLAAKNKLSTSAAVS